MATDQHVSPWIDRVLRSPAVRSGYTSLVVHLLLAIALAVLALRGVDRPRPRPTLISFASEKPLAEGDAMHAELDAAVAVAAPFPAEPVAVPDATATVVAAPAPIEPPAAPVLELEPTPPVIDAVDRSLFVPVATAPRPAQPAGGSTSRPAGSPVTAVILEARRGRGRSGTARSRGATAASEMAVERGLAWLAAHQAGDGSWQFDLSGCRCDGACRDRGTIHSSTASTAIALLPFLGAGNTQLDGPYQQTVSRGLYYLISRMQPTPRGGDFCEGTMYGHGVTTLALAEAYGMTQDAMLLEPLREAIRFIATAQDQHGGGWRYLPGQAGDITVTAWQVAALKSAALAGVETPSPTIDGVRRFLESVQAANGSAYGYRSPDAKPCTSAIGLLCRLYTGWKRDDERLHRGVTTLAKAGPQPMAIYQNFYLAQTLLQMNHPVWPRWNAKNRDQTVAQQARFGHEAGSWFFADPDTAPGGRLAHTALAVLTLEVYYRLLPIYGEEAVTAEF